jgi:hypothetical protein
MRQKLANSAKNGDFWHGFARDFDNQTISKAC